MRQRRRCALAGLAAICVGALTAAGGCNVLGTGSDGDGSETYDPDIDPARFVDGVDNPLFPLTPGTTYLYEADTPDGLETIEVYVTDQTREILGITCMVVRDTVTVDGELVEDTYDWYAQDGDGNVWYMGEDSKEYESGVVVSTAGSWEAGVDGAKPGIIMQADPQVGQVYRQEFYEGEAEDMGEVIALDVAVTLGDGTTYTCLQTRDFTPLEPDVNEYKYYAPGVGVVLEEVVDGDERVELVSVTTD